MPMKYPMEIQNLGKMCTGDCVYMGKTDLTDDFPARRLCCFTVHPKQSGDSLLTQKTVFHIYC